MLTYYINLDRRLDRRELMEEQFSRLGMAAIRMAALMPKDLSTEQIARYCDPRHFDNLTPPELSCSFSHLAAMRLFLASDESFALILEDDAILSAKLPTFVEDFMARPPALDLLRIETSRRKLQLLRTETISHGVSINRYVGWEGGTAGYIISRRGAEAILRDPSLWTRHIDRALFESFGPLARRIVVRQSDPALCIQLHEIQDGAAAGPQSDLRWHDERRTARATYPIRYAAYGFAKAFHRDVIFAIEKMWFRVGHGAKRKSVPFDRG